MNKIRGKLDDVIFKQIPKRKRIDHLNCTFGIGTIAVALYRILQKFQIFDILGSENG